MLKDRKLAILGVGKLGEAILAGLAHAGAIPMDQVVVTARRPSRAQEVAARYGCRAAECNRAAVEGADITLLSVKPFTVHDVVEEVRDLIEGDHLLISVAAGVATASVERALARNTPVVRAMPNTPALVNAGMTALAGGKHAGEQDLERAQEIFRSVGRCLVLEERHMDAVTGLSASGPAFLYVIIESMAEAGVKIGLPRDVATELAAQTTLGAATMVLETGEHPAKLKDMVTTPAGCTVDGLLELEAGGVRVTLIKAVVEAARRAGELDRG
jgi:pyrroline-5-carboxylate reductase